MAGEHEGARVTAGLGLSQDPVMSFTLGADSISSTTPDKDSEVGTAECVDLVEDKDKDTATDSDKDAGSRNGMDTDKGELTESISCCEMASVWGLTSSLHCDSDKDTDTDTDAGFTARSTTN